MAELLVLEPINQFNQDKAAAEALAAIKERIRMQVWPIPSSDVTTLVEGTDANGEPLGQQSQH